MKGSRFIQDCKKYVVEQSPNETTGAAELYQRYKIESDQIYIWKKRYIEGKLYQILSPEADLVVRV